MASSIERILILCKTYPSPSTKYAETSCVAGMSESGKLVRLFPVPFRFISDDQQFRKWQWVTARIEPSYNDKRPESHRVFVDTINCDPDSLKAGKEGWPRRMELLAKVPIFEDFAAVEVARQTSGATLALLRPRRIVGLEITPTESAMWTDEELAKLSQLQHQGGLFDDGTEAKQSRLLEKLPYDFHYRYECEVAGETFVYRTKLVDWELGALYRRLVRQYGTSGWEEPFRAKYEKELPSRDLLLLLGTIHRFPNQWLAVSVICPPKPPSGDQDQVGLFPS